MSEQAIKQNFYQLIGEYNVKIPIIQRDYAQGRECGKAVTVREHLIDVLMEALQIENKVLDLNFVYGTEKNSDGIKTFLPVDGQQRLTTLYLFYYYFFVKKGEEGIRDYKKCKDFLYATRTSATEFFEWLSHVQEGDSICEAFRNKEKLKECIYDMPEYQASWNNDPTVKSAITMLETIKAKVSKEFVDKYYSKLVGENCPIFFSVIIEKSEDNEKAETNADKTYIRMNARGKSLEDFENLRSMIDSVDEKVNPDKSKVDIIGHYDRSYLDKMYDVYNKGSLTLKEVTEIINAKSYYAFNNIYNIVALCFNGLNFFDDEIAYKNYIYICSRQEQNEVQKKALSIYIEMLDTYFQYCELEKEFGDHNYIFHKNIIKKGQQSNETRVAEIIYCYYYKQKHKKLPTKQQVDDLKYILENLAMKRWACFWGDEGNLKNICKAVSTETDVFAYFNKLSMNMEKEEINSILKEDIAVNDLFVRFKEQVIKIKLIEMMKNSNKRVDVSYRYFERYEELYKGQYEERKIQFFLHCADCWIGTDETKWSENTFEELEGYLQKGQKWFNENETEHLEFLKLYAIIANLDDAKVLKSAEEINCGCGEHHIWKREMCFWGDADEYGNQGKDWKKLCALAKETFCTSEDVFKNAKCKLADSSYATCWLKYAVEKNYKELLTQKLNYENSEVLIQFPFGWNQYIWRKYMLYVYKLGDNNIRWGDEKISLDDIYWSEKIISISGNRKEKIPWEEHELPCTKKIVRVTETFNATLEWSTTLEIQNKKDYKKEDCLFGVEKIGDIYCYKRIVYNKEKPFELCVEEYEVTQDVKKMLELHHLEGKIIDAFKMEAFLELYDEATYGVGWIRKDSGQTKNYKRKSPNSRTWEYRRIVRSQVEPEIRCCLI